MYIGWKIAQEDLDATAPMDNCWWRAVDNLTHRSIIRPTKWVNQQVHAAPENAQAILGILYVRKLNNIWSWWTPSSHFLA